MPKRAFCVQIVNTLTCHGSRARSSSPADTHQICRTLLHSWYKYADEAKGLHPFDGVTEQWFASLDTFVESLDAPSHRTEVEPDVAYLLDPASIHFVMAGPPTVVIGE